MSTIADQLEQDLLSMLSSPGALVETTQVDLQYKEFTENVAETALQWTRDVSKSMATLCESLANVDDSDIPIPSRLEPLTIRERVEEEITMCVVDPTYTPRGIAELTGSIDGGESPPHLQTRKLGLFFNDEKYLKYFSNLKYHLPIINAAGPLGFSVACPTISIQVYKTINNREVKILEIDVPLLARLDEIFRFITSIFPNDYMFDGPIYAGSGMFVIDNVMYTVGPENYSVPYVSWLAGTEAASKVLVRQMADTVIGEIVGLPQICTSAKCSFLLFNGNEELKIFFSNIAHVPSGGRQSESTAINPVNVTTPMIKFKRRIPRITRCILCKTRAADLAVVDDVILPLNPSYCCQPCYRRIRSDRAGEFVPPPGDVIVSAYRQI